MKPYANNLGPLGIVFLMLMIFGSCISDDDGGRIPSCTDEIIHQFEMVPFNGQDMECKFVLNAYEFRGEKYFVPTNNCIDLILVVYNCKGDQVCMLETNEFCTNFWLESESLGIVGIQE